VVVRIECWTDFWYKNCVLFDCLFSIPIEREAILVGNFSVRKPGGQKLILRKGGTVPARLRWDFPERFPKLIFFTHRTLHYVKTDNEVGLFPSVIRAIGQVEITAGVVIECQFGVLR
jgi:hypothetical protein